MQCRNRLCTAEYARPASADAQLGRMARPRLPSDSRGRAEICRTFYLPREFSSIVVTAVYIPPQADTSLALSKLHDELSGYINKHPEAACIIAGDFNKANLKKVIPNFHQHISCPTRGLNTLDHCYTQFKNAYKANSLPAFGKSDHAAIFLTPDYKQRIVQEPPVEREVTRWSSHSEATLLMMSTGTCSGRVHLTSANSRR